MSSLKNILGILLMIWGFASTAQQKELTIKYNIALEADERIEEAELIACNSMCLSKIIQKTMVFSRLNPDGEMVERLYYNFKNYDDNVVCSNSDVLPDTFIKEDMDGMHWQPLKGCDTILGYRCMKAKMHYRGRDYEAWFTTDLPFKAAPWKFYNLPGVMLKVQSLDNFVKMEAKELKIINQVKEIQYPYRRKKHVTWEKYLVQYQKMINRSQEIVRTANAEDLGDDKFAIPQTIEKIPLKLDKLVTKYQEAKK